MPTRILVGNCLGWRAEVTSLSCLSGVSLVLKWKFLPLGVQRSLRERGCRERLLGLGECWQGLVLLQKATTRPEERLWRPPGSHVRESWPAASLRSLVYRVLSSNPVTTCFSMTFGWMSGLCLGVQELAWIRPPSPLCTLISSLQHGLLDFIHPPRPSPPQHFLPASSWDGPTLSQWRPRLGSGVGMDLAQLLGAVWSPAPYSQSRDQFPLVSPALGFLSSLPGPTLSVEGAPAGPLPLWG